MTKIIELRPNANLIDQNFETYQFSADPVPVIRRVPLSQDVYRQEPKADQDSWLEARLFAFHNHLFKNPYDSSYWYVDESRDVWRLGNDGGPALIRGLTPLQNDPADYNPSVAFASTDVVVLCNGGATGLDIWLDRGSRGHFQINEVEAGVILDARWVEAKNMLVVAMCLVVNVDGKKCSRLTILTYQHHPARQKPPVNVLVFMRKQILNVKGPIEYVYIEASGDFIHTISQDTAIFVSDSKKPVKPKDPASSADPEMKIPRYYWSQDEDSLTVWIKVGENNRDDRANISVTSGKISISVRDTVLMEGDSQHRLDPELTTWKRDGDTIQLDLGKSESGLMWSELIRGDTGGECLPNETLAAEIHSRLAHLCTSDPQSGASDGQPVIGFNADQLEECDSKGKDNFLQRINLDEHTTTHLAILGTSNKLLFTHKLGSGQALCLRHDNHGVVWIPETDDSGDWVVKHVDTFPGFGYVEASKTNKKFCVSPPDGSYVAIVEHAKLVLLYEKPEAGETVAKQRIVELSDAAPFMGAVAENNSLILLTKNEIYELEMFP